MTDPEEEGKSRGFTVVDRRGQQREDEPAEPEPRGPEPAAEAGAGSPGVGETGLPKVDFATFALSLGTSAFYHMGLAPDPQSGQTAEPNLPLARQTIDTLEMLEAKTRGNLEPEEARLLESLLYELRMRFVEASK